MAPAPVPQPIFPCADVHVLVGISHHALTVAHTVAEVALVMVALLTVNDKGDNEAQCQTGESDNEELWQMCVAIHLQSPHLNRK